jgi:hypothetical protein
LASSILLQQIWGYFYQFEENYSKKMTKKMLPHYREANVLKVVVVVHLDYIVDFHSNH